MKASVSALLLLSSWACAEEIPQPILRCSSAQQDNELDLNRVEQCSTLAPCASPLGQGEFEFNNNICRATESCGTWDIQDQSTGKITEYAGCIINQYCGRTGLKYQDASTDFKCPSGTEKKKAAVKLMASLLAAFIALSISI